MSGVQYSALARQRLARSFYETPWVRFRYSVDWAVEEQRSKQLHRAATPVLLAFDEKPKFQFPRIPQRRTTTLNGRVFVIDVLHEWGAVYRAVARVDGDARVIGDARIIFRPPNAVRLSDLWVDEDLRRNGLGSYLIELSGELFPNIEWADTEPAKPFYNALLNRQLIKKIKWGKHPLAQARYAMAGNEITTKRRRA